MNREIKFNAYIEIGDNKEITAIIPGVTIYGSGEIGCEVHKFNKAIEQSGWNYDGDGSFIKGDNFIDAGEFNVLDGDEWVYFEGIPLQLTGRTDKNGVESCEGDVIQNSVQNIFQIKWDDEEAAFIVDSIRTHSGLKERYPLGTYIKMLQKSGSWFEIIGTINSPLLATEGEKA